ncbi:MAG: hypothetical protein P4M15_06090, partial [Alphaproteobacteria bacterium]|nr:hypothetical protein [Alphaproteobacteria bacterium]
FGQWFAHGKAMPYIQVNCKVKLHSLTTGLTVDVACPNPLRSGGATVTAGTRSPAHSRDPANARPGSMQVNVGKVDFPEGKWLPE